MEKSLPSAGPQSRCLRSTRWLLSWRTLRWGLWSLACLATLITLFYTVENWRGRRAWAACQRELKAGGVELDWAALIPPAVPDDQNFFSAPKMAAWFVGRGTNDLSQRLDHPASSLLGAGNPITNRADAAAYLAWSRRLELDFNLIREALKRPCARMGGAYDQPYGMPIPAFVTVRKMAQTLAQRAHCHLLLGQPGEAVDDLTFLHDLRRVLEGRPTGKPMTLIAAMINVAVAGVYSEAVSEGLRQRAWRESDLVTLQAQLDQVSLLPIVAEAYRSEQVATSHALEQTPGIFVNSEDSLGSKLRNPTYLYLKLAPRGWIYQTMAIHAREMQAVIEAFDARLGILEPHRTKLVQSLALTNSPGSAYNFLCRMTLPNFYRATQTLARQQTLANQTRSACALERYRLDHGAYPGSLDPLVPKYLAEPPHDLQNGQACRYRPETDGGFLLYSVGWNETDDGGREGKTGDFDDGDWVWRQPPAAVR